MKEELVIETPRLIIRDLLLTDWPGVHAWSSNPEVVRFLEWGPNTEEDTINFVLLALAAQRDEPRTEYHLALVRKSDEGLIGSFSLLIPDPKTGHALVGYLMSREFWGQGYATEAMTAVLGFAFDQLRRTRIEATCDVRNIASARVLEKAGLKRLTTLQEHKLRHGVWCDSFLYAIDAANWKRERISNEE